MSELALTDHKPEELVRRSSDIAGLCKEIVVATAVNIHGKKYVKVEGWQSIATAHGCVAGTRAVERVEGGYRCIAELKRGFDGLVLATAEGFVGDDEITWQKRPDYARRAMCQTRAISRVCRSAFAHVVVLMNAGLQTTPAEEIPSDGFKDDGFKDDRQPIQQPKAKQAPKASFKLIGVKEVKSKPDAKRAWTAWFCTFLQPHGETIECGTFDAALAPTLTKLTGQQVHITYKPGRKGGTQELLTIEQAVIDVGEVTIQQHLGKELDRLGITIPELLKFLVAQGIVDELQTDGVETVEQLPPEVCEQLAKRPALMSQLAKTK